MREIDQEKIFHSFLKGIAVGLSTKILPHNFNELIDASIKILKGGKPKIYPDFPNGGQADFSNYNDGKRGGKVRVRAKISVLDSKTLKISELPHGTTTVSLINSILKANDKGKIKIKKIDDNTSEGVEILVYLPAGISPDKTIDALYSFTDCELAISPLGCVIDSDTPRFMGVSEMLQVSTQNTLELLKKELEINLKELQEKWHFSSLEKNEKDRILLDFLNKKINLIVSTTVIEVGIDFPNANVIVIENANKFGLSQLHQLRGRVGRGDKESYCILMFKTNLSENAKKRIKILKSSNDGFKISEEDMKLRGFGDILGFKQSGLKNFRLADPIQNQDLFFLAEKEIKKIEDRNESLDKYFQLLKLYDRADILNDIV